MLEIVRGVLFFVGPMAALYFFPTLMNLVLGSPNQFAKTEEKSALPDAAAERSGRAVDDQLEKRQERQERQDRREPSFPDDELELDLEPYVVNPTPDLAVAANMAGAEGAVLATPGVTRNAPLPSNVFVFQRRSPQATTAPVEEAVYTAPQMPAMAQQEYNQENMPVFDPDEFA